MINTDHILRHQFNVKMNLIQLNTIQNNQCYEEKWRNSLHFHNPEYIYIMLRIRFLIQIYEVYRYIHLIYKKENNDLQNDKYTIENNN